MAFTLTVRPYDEGDPYTDPTADVGRLGEGSSAPMIVSGTYDFIATMDDLAMAAQVARVRFVDVIHGLSRAMPPEEEASWQITDPLHIRYAERGTNPSSTREVAESAGVWRYRYNSAMDYARTIRVVAIAEDADGVELARTDVTPNIQVHNHGGYATLIAVNGQTGAAALEAIRAPMSGTVSFTVRAHRADHLRTITKNDGTSAASDGSGFVIASTLYVDGLVHPDYPSGGFNQTFNRHTDTTFTFDTRKYLNGEHTLAFVAETTEPKIQHPYYPPSGGIESLFSIVEVKVIFDNGVVPSRLIPKYRDVYLTPSESVTIPCELEMTDGTRRAATTADGLRMVMENRVYYGGVFVHNARDIARGDGRSVVTAQATAGLDTYVTATFSVGEYAHVTPATTRVIVRPAHAMPHFAPTGELLTAYDPAKSLFVANMFFLTVDDFRDPDTNLLGTAYEDTVATNLLAAGINALNAGIYANGFYMSPDPTEAAWQTAQSAAMQPYFDLLDRQPGLYILGAGDGILRTRDEMKWTYDKSLIWTTHPVTYAFQLLVNDGRTIAIDMVDETNLILGAGPDTGWDYIPGDNYFPSTFVRDLRTASRATTGTLKVPISWPVLGLSHPVTAREWMGEGSPSDYASLYWTSYSNPDSVYTRPVNHRRDFEVSTRSWYVRWNLPRLAQVSVMGSFYRKMTKGDHFHPLHDLSGDRRIGNDPRMVTNQVWQAVAEGYAGVRVYGFDSVSMREFRRDQDAPSNAEFQTGASWVCGIRRWNAMANGLTLVHDLKDLVFMPNTHAPTFAPECWAGVKSGVRGVLFTIGNAADYEVTVPVPSDLISLMGAVTRVRLSEADRVTDTLAALPTEITLGSTEVWVCYRRLP